MSKNRTYQGHPSWNLWNVSLWLANDEALYGLARYHILRASNRDIAAREMLARLHEMGHTHTPDGAPYTKTAIRHGMIGL